MLAGIEYNTEWQEYVCVDNVGNLISPGYISQYFAKKLKRYGLRRIRFHDLRHTNATLLLEEGVSLKEIQDWMGHKNFQITTDI